MALLGEQGDYYLTWPDLYSDEQLVSSLQAFLFAADSDYDAALLHAVTHFAAHLFDAACIALGALWHY